MLTSDPIALRSTRDLSVAAKDKKKRPRRGRKATSMPNVEAKPKKALLLDELGDILVEQLYAHPKLVEPLNAPVAEVDHLRSTLAAIITASSCASSGSSSSRTLTVFNGTPPTSLDSRTPQESPASKSITPAPPTGENLRSKTKRRRHADVFSLDDFSTMTTIEHLAAQYGRVAHMGILDRSYRFFVNQARTAALSFKVQNRVAIVGGDPLCDTDAIPDLLVEFAVYRRRHRWGIAFMGASESFARGYAQLQGWTTIRFGTERVLNPQTNDVLLERGGKRITVQNRQLLHRHKGGITLRVYSPATHGTDTELQSALVAIYDAWRAERNRSATPQAFITVYELFALPSLMTFVYTRGPDGQVNGFAALRRLAAGGYHIDPCIAAPDSPKGISDLLLIATMALLHRTGVSYLGFGFEPLHALDPGEITGLPRPFIHLARELYGHAFHRLPIHGKKAYHDRFHPDPPQDSGLYLVFPRGVPGPFHLLAMAHMANISLRKIMWADVRGLVLKDARKSSQKPVTAASDAVITGEA
ncbi:hypothetical protein N7474_003754 [Penicillium riverlandense]|uniref:uncharacterized protein n=1 Tax=Penicillium riverlandense TaxID=1903569 RepID=UPI00254659D9|nr:uncharacterized protein N7474_003754 [Penicillium riverlandense]KAJ5818163.1 hypothetical protein N7474_003754 [Penicillium riverlandense]